MAEAYQRSRLLSAREEFIVKLAAEAGARLSNVASSNAGAYNVLLKGLIKQAIERLKGEKIIEVHARPQDVAIAQKAAAAAAAEIAASRGASAPALTVTAVADASLASSAGGVVVWTAAGRIKCNNTLEARLGLALHDLTPVIRDILFPSGRAVAKVKPPVYFAHAAGGHDAAAPAHVAAVVPVARVAPAPTTTVAPTTVAAHTSSGAAAVPAASAANVSATADPFAF